MILPDTPEQIEKQADLLQAQGPDEFPRGYYVYLACRMAAEESR